MNGKEPNVKWITDRQTAEMLSMHVQSLRNWRAQGVGPVYSKIGRAVRYALQDVIQFCEDRKVKVNG